jgi:L-ascorbate metabolism protein UlaG (beta-lactamase superfamily)
MRARRCLHAAVILLVALLLPSTAPAHDMPAAVPLEALPDPEEGSVLFVGTATVLIRYRGMTILTDPNFLHRGEQVHLGYGLTSERLTEPAIAFEQLPPIDLVVLSHMHEDHFDALVQQKLRRDVPIVTTPAAAEDLRELGFTAATGIERWQEWRYVKNGTQLHITAMPGRHGPPLVSSALPPVMGSLLDFRDAQGQRLYRIYISGDTLVHDDIREIPKRFPNIDLALLHLGGTRVLGILVTMDGSQGVQMLKIVAPHTAIPVHYDDYTVFKSPLEDFREEVRKAALEQQVQYLDRGQRFVFRPSATAETAETVQ